MAKSINLADLSANSIVVFKNGDAVGTIKVDKAAAGDVTIIANGKSVNLSDAGCSYLSKSIEPMKMAEATANPSAVLAVLAKGSTNLVSGTDCANATVKAGASETSFEEAASEIDLANVGGSTVKYVHAGLTGEIEVVEVKQGGVIIMLPNLIELSDDGSSYISTDLQEIKLAASEADPTKVLFALKKGTTKLVSPKLVSNAKIVAGSIDTAFIK